jgi:LSD1 subclass zinc finger protein
MLRYGQVYNTSHSIREFILLISGASGVQCACLTTSEESILFYDCSKIVKVSLHSLS